MEYKVGYKISKTGKKYKIFICKCKNCSKQMDKVTLKNVKGYCRDCYFNILKNKNKLDVEKGCKTCNICLKEKDINKFWHLYTT